MVIATGGAVAIIASGATGAIPAAITGTGVGGAAVASGATATTAVAGAAGVGVSSGAIAGAAAAAEASSCVVTGALVGAGAGGSAGVGVSGMGLGAAALLTGGAALLVVGTSQNDEEEITFDCWKPILRDNTTKPSDGILLKDLLNHPKIAHVSVTGSHVPELPNIVIENVWQERFVIEYLLLTKTREMVCHAKRLSN